MTAVGEESASLTSQCLGLCQTLASQGQSFTFSLSIGSTFNFSMATNIQEKSAPVPASRAVKRKSPSTRKRNARRKREFLENQQACSKQIIPPHILLFHWALFHRATPVALNLFLIAQLKAAHTTQTPLHFAFSFCLLTPPSNVVVGVVVCKTNLNQLYSSINHYRAIGKYFLKATYISDVVF